MRVFEVGDLVEGKLTGVVVKVTEVNIDKKYFNGIIIKQGSSSYCNGRYSKFFDMGSFKNVIKEDKMENRIVRKLEDLDNVFSKDKKVLCKYYYDKFHERDVVYVYDTRKSKDMKSDLWEIFTIYTLDKHSLNKLDFAGINIEYKPLRTVEEVLEEMKDNSLKNSSSLYGIRYEFNFEKNKGVYSVFKNMHSVTLGAYAFEKETAQKYADELNDIMGCK